MNKQYVVVEKEAKKELEKELQFFAEMATKMELATLENGWLVTRGVMDWIEIEWGVNINADSEFSAYTDSACDSYKVFYKFEAAA